MTVITVCGIHFCDLLYFHSNSSIAGIFLAMLLLFFILFFVGEHKKWRGIFLISIAIFLFALLLLSNGRAGWIGFAVAGSFIFYIDSNRKKRKLFLLTASAIFCFLFLFFYFYKLDSSAGRKHIYSISLKIFNDNSFFGIGIGKFKSQFNEYQAEYFATHSLDNKRALLADNTFYAFNDYLQWIIETGLIGLLFLLITFYFIIRRIKYLFNHNLNKPSLLVGATASLICVSVAALFSYPFQIMLIQATVLISLGIISFYPNPTQVVSSHQKINDIFCKCLVVALVAVIVIKLQRDIHRTSLEKKGFNLSRTGYKNEAILTYKKIIERFPNSGQNWFLLAQQLHYSNNLPEAYKNLKEGMNYYVDNKVYKLKADIEQEMQMYNEAEKSYLRAIYMVPNRMGSRLDLLNFYVTRNDTTNAIYWAKSILNMPVKVPSQKVDNMLETTRSILEKIERKTIQNLELLPTKLIMRNRIRGTIRIILCRA